MAPSDRLPSRLRVPIYFGMLEDLRRWIVDLRPRQAAIEAEARRLIARHGSNAPLVARALSGPHGRPSPFGRKVAERVDQLARRTPAGS